MAIYDVRQRASDLEEEAKQGARESPRADQPAWKDVRREAATMRRSIPETVHVLQNDPETPATTGTGLSPSAYREDQAVQQPPTRLGEPNTAMMGARVAMGGALAQQEAERANQPVDETRARREDLWQQRQLEAKDAAARGDPDAARKVQEYDDWRSTYDRMSPIEQERENALQDHFHERQEALNQYVDSHPHFYTDERGDLYADETSSQERRDMQRLMRQREQAMRRITQHQQPYRGTTNRLSSR
jgi:hypothetical protein